MTNIVNIKTLRPGEGFDIYIGRKNDYAGLEESIYKNPYVIGVHGDRDFCIEKYKLYLNTRPDLLLKVKESKGKTIQFIIYGRKAI